jgi:molecular chaperone GrpE
MVNNNNDETTIQDDSEITYDNPEPTETELSEEEATAEQKLKVLRKKLEEATEKNRDLGEEVQRTKADFLNARKRLEEEVIRSRQRDAERHIEKLLPLADSFRLAMLDKETWEKGDEKWRKGVEGINMQLQSILRGYNVEATDPTGQPFNPAEHDALSMVPVSDATQHNIVLTVMQLGYIQNVGTERIIIRPARVTVGEHTPQA